MPDANVTRHMLHMQQLMGKRGAIWPRTRIMWSGGDKNGQDDLEEESVAINLAINTEEDEL